MAVGCPLNAQDKTTLPPFLQCGQPWVWLGLSHNLRPEIEANIAILCAENSACLGFANPHLAHLAHLEWGKVPPSREGAQDESRLPLICCAAGVRGSPYSLGLHLLTSSRAVAGRLGSRMRDQIQSYHLQTT